ncbi:MAG TPA: asparagine synthase (glutamine-hydrolyzing) [Candidatus Acidoferrales bacterium]|nr:asparagine synthase (glutamine-hydrolyzing) [Candidatus Acidoferrales bacterium]
MCGICGVIGIESKEASEAIVRRMLGPMIHRGPDEEGILLASAVAIGMRRLSIIDLPGGSQPIWNEDATLAVIFNGEIYNYRELRGELEQAGHRFRTHSDTEVIVHAYESWGESCVRRFHGMFSFAVMEMPQGVGGPPARVFIARDPLGIKPLYYTFADGTLLFASEVRALLASQRILPRLSNAALSSYLLFGSVGEPLTLVEGVFSLPPGHMLNILPGASLRVPEPKPYWDLNRFTTVPADSTSPRRDRSSVVTEVRSLLEAAVRGHLIADVPVGVFLSSGLDSTALATLASRAGSGIHTFTVAFPDLEFSEAEQARRTAERLGTQHRELTLSSEEMVARLDEAVASFDQPSMDGINTYFVSWAARQAGLNVALSGLGSDEIFGGYTSFRSTALLSRVAAMSRLIPRPLRCLTTRALDSFRGFSASPDASRKALAAWLDPASLPHPYFFTRSLFTPRTVASCLDEESYSWNALAWWKWLSQATRRSNSLDRFTQVSWLELRSYLLNTLLRDTDGMSMAHSLEVRVPFLDLPLVERVLSLPRSCKVVLGRPKALLIEAIGDALPKEIVAQRKRTFTFPWDNWLRGALGKRVAEGLADWSPVLASSLSREFAMSAWNDFLGHRTSWSRPWSLYVLNEWVKRHLRSGAADCSPRSRGATVSVT